VRVALAASLLVTLTLAVAAVAQAQGGERRAGLVVQYGDGSVATACVRFAEEELTGLQLLERSGLPIVVQSGGIGAAVCKIGPDGCDYPAESCFCKRDGARSIYWAYYSLSGGSWSYSNLGVASTRVRDGEVQGWAWGLGESGSGAQPPVLGIDAVCTAQAPAPTALASATATAQPAPTAEPSATATAQPAPATAQPAPTAEPSATATAQPAPATAQPAPATAQPAPATAQPAPATALPSATATAQPASTALPSAAATTQAAGGAITPAAPPGGLLANYLGFGAVALVLIVGAVLAARRR
jgi:hypothetical protein